MTRKDNQLQYRSIYQTISVLLEAIKALQSDAIDYKTKNDGRHRRNEASVKALRTAVSDIRDEMRRMNDFMQATHKQLHDIQVQQSNAEEKWRQWWQAQQNNQ